MNTIVIIPAGGHGSRFESSLPKQYHTLFGIPIIIRTIQTFLSSDKIDKVVLNISPDFRDFLLEQFGKNNIDISRIELLTLPGSERQETVLNALNNAKAMKIAEIILVHDAVRCLVTKGLIERTIQEAEQNKAVCPGLAPKNTIKKVDDNSISEETIDRSSLREIQTPQGFKKAIISRAYLQAECDKFLGTDSASLVERRGQSVKVIEGEEQNFKITTPMDFALAEFLLAKKKERFMIIGAKGQLGKEFVKYCQKENINYTAYDIDTLDICYEKKVRDTVERDKPTVIINCAAYNDVDKAESNFEDSMRINSLGPENIAKAAKSQCVLLVHFSTDYVFDGVGYQDYDEDDTPNPINQYGKSKLAGEKIIQKIAGQFIIIRTSRLFGDGKQNFPYKLSQWTKNKSVLTITDDTISRATSTAYLLEKTIRAIKNNHTGLLHIAEGKALSLCQWAKEIVRENDKSISIIPVKQADFKSTAARPKYSVLKSKFDY